MKNTMSLPNNPSSLSHLDESGQANMVDVSDKGTTLREAIAQSTVRMGLETFQAIEQGNAPKGDVLGTVRLAGIMAAKQTSALIPLCHPLPITGVKILITPEPSLPGYVIQARVRTKAETGVEMEALTAVSIAALTLYDMAKALDKGITIESIHLLHKSGGKSGEWNAPA
jgi:cyclic pyranopterin monophosphate synthase